MVVGDATDVGCNEEGTRILGNEKRCDRCAAGIEGSAMLNGLYYTIL